MRMYQTLAQVAETEITVLNSRFIATGTEVTSVEAADTFLKQVRQRYPDASHHCYAFQLVGPPVSERFSDDGEPNGTAGRPILTVLSHQLSNAMIVVTRYFWGTKLGKGGLVKAYTQAAQALLHQAERVHREPMRELKLSYPYPLEGSLRYWLQQHDLQTESVYTHEITTSTAIPERLRPEIQLQLQDWQAQGLSWEWQ